MNTEPLASPTQLYSPPISGDSDAQKIKIEVGGKPEEDLKSPAMLHYDQKKVELNPLSSPISADSVTKDIYKGSVSLSSSTSKEGSHNHVLPHMGPAPDRLEDSGVASSGPDITFGVRSSLDHERDTTANSTAPLEESKEEPK